MALELLSEQLNVALTPTTLRRLKQCVKKSRQKPVDFARDAIEEKIDGVASKRLPEDVVEAAAEVQQLGGNPAEILRAALPTLTAQHPAGVTS